MLFFQINLCSQNLFFSECPPKAHMIFQGSWTTHGALWIAMEYCGGGSVADLVHAADGPLDQDIIAYLCAETLAGLTYLHSIGKVPPLSHAHSP